jgi:hypothetical protein
MDFSFLMLAGAFGGGMFGAAIGGLPAFVFTGFAVLAGAGLAITGADYDFLGNIAFGPVFGPHISFAGGVAAAAYARRRNELEAGKDIVTPLASLATPDVLLVGGAFGVLGYLLQVAFTPVIGNLTDVIALIVFVSGVLVRVMFGSTGIFGKVTSADHDGGRFTPGGVEVWVEYQQEWVQAAAIGLASGLLAAFASLSILEAYPEATAAANVIGFGISAATLVFLALGLEFPVTHHMTIAASYAAVATGSILVGAVAGIVSALIGEAGSRLFLIHGDSHVDPPAFAIFIMASLVFIPALLIGG